MIAGSTTMTAGRADARFRESVLLIGAPDATLEAAGSMAGWADAPRSPRSPMIGVLAQPQAPGRTTSVGVVIVVGGPQTRVGSHRQFVVLARELAAAGYPCLRFDYTGMGDSPGPKPDFEKAGPDIESACNALIGANPACRQIVLWGLCDGATAAMLYARGDPRVSAVVAANPWARSVATHSAALIGTHYGSRLRSREFWKKLLGGRIDVIAAVREALGHAWRARTARGAANPTHPADPASPAELPVRLARELTAPRVPVRLQLSGRDLTAAEFELAMKHRGALESGPATSLRLADADHTFSDPAHWRAVVEDTLAFVGRAQLTTASSRPANRAVSARRE